jgi:trigger factor
MNITQESTGEYTALIHINIEENDYSEKVNQKLKDYRKKAQMPGFRPGMVPMGLIKKMYGQSVVIDEVNNLVSESLNGYIKEKNIELLADPLPNEEKTKQIDLETQKSFDFYFDIAVQPEINIEINDKIKVPYYKISVSEKEIDNAVKDILDRNADVEDMDAVTEDSHITVTLQETDENGNVLENGITKNIDFDINEIKTKKNQNLFIGKKKDESVIAVPYELFGTKEKTAAILAEHDKKSETLNKTYKFTITGINKKIVPELNENFFEKIYPGENIKTVEDFRNRIKKDLASHYVNDADKQFLNDVSDKLIEMANINLPDEFMKRWLLYRNEGKINEEQIESQYDSFSKSTKWNLIESKLRKENPEDLNINIEDIRNEVRRYFFQGNPPEEKDPNIEKIVDQILSNKDEEERIAQMIMERKYIAFFKEKVGKNEKEVTLDKFIEIISKQ